MARTKQTARPITLPIIRKVADPDQARVNQEVHTSLRALTDHPFSIGHLVSPLLIPAGGVVTLVPHLLARVPAGWFAVSPQGVGFVYQTQAPTDEHLFLTANVAVTTSLFVF